MIIATQDEIDIRERLRNEILALKRADVALREAHQRELAELKRQLDNAITFARITQADIGILREINETLTEQLREAKAAIGNGSV